MNAIARFLWLLLLLPFCTLADTELLHRDKRGTRIYKDHCVDSDIAAIREMGETWLRWRGQKVEYCRCASKARARCHYIPITTCYVSRCYSGGTCKEAVFSNDFICLCPPGFTGQQCEINLNEKCVSGQGSDYRGTWSISSSSTECINWNSTFLRGKKFTARRPETRIIGLGNHNYCRNPDGDSRPWCYVYKNSQIVWDFCSIPNCTKAHCFQEGFTEDRINVILGRTFRLQNSSSEQIFDVERYWIHEQYNDVNYDNDMALLKLKSENGICAVNSAEVLPVCLPEPGMVLPDWMECEISGYGKDKEFSPFYSERIKQGHVRLWPQEQCVPKKISGREVTLNMLCAGDTRGLDDACKGDSGGPLVCEMDNQMTLIGLISWGDGCGKKDMPGVYTRVTKYTTWIFSKMSSN